MNCGTHIVPKQINAMLAGCTNVVSMAVSDSVESAIRHMCVDGHVNGAFKPVYVGDHHPNGAFRAHFREFLLYQIEHLEMFVRKISSSAVYSEYEWFCRFEYFSHRLSVMQEIVALYEPMEVEYACGLTFKI